jgi:hypothetical protein
VPDQWPLARHIFLAHSASLRRVIFSKTPKSRRLLHSFNGARGGCIQDPSRAAGSSFLRSRVSSGNRGLEAIALHILISNAPDCPSRGSEE